MSRSERLSAYDAALLHFVSEAGLSHAGSISIFEGTIPFEEYARDLERRVQALPRFQQVALPVPFNVAYPTWEVDPHYRFADHVAPIQLDPPGTWDQLLRVASELYSIRLDPKRPHWFIYLISGLDGNRSAVLFKIHHAITDGIGAEEFQRVMFGRELPKIEGHHANGTGIQPGPSKRLWRGLRDNSRTGIRVAVRVPANTVRLVRWMFSSNARHTVRMQLKFMRAPALRFPFNTPCSGAIKLATTKFKLDDMRTIGKARNATINDVLLTIVGSAMQSLAHRHNLDVAGKALKVQIPVNMRQDHDPRNMGNIATVAAIPVPLDSDNPLDLLQEVSAITRSVKQSKAPLAMHRLIGAVLFCMTPVFAPMVQRSVASLKNQRNAIRKGKIPGTTMVVSNVPRRSVPLFVAGRPVQMRYAIASPSPHVGIACVAMTCGDYLGVSIAANSDGASDLDSLVAYLDQVFAEMRTAVKHETQTS